MKRRAFEYANFHDPFGLIVRMLRSGDRAARSALYRAGLEVLLRPLDRLLGIPERRCLARASRSELPIILIVGPPRSGSTLLCQTLARYLPVSFFNNLSALFPHAPITVCRLLNRLLLEREADFHSFYGNTVGLAAPNDGFAIWNRWLGADRYAAPSQLSASARQSMRVFFWSWLAMFERPLLNKNNRNTVCMELLSSVFDNVYFVEIQRRPLYVAQSLLIARRNVQGSRNVGWGLGSTPASDAPDSPLESVVQQVFRVQAEISAQKQRIRADRYIEVPYEQFCANPTLIVREIYARIWRTELGNAKLARELKPFQSANKTRLPDDEFRRLREIVHETFKSCAIG